MSAIDPAATLGKLVTERPTRAHVFERLRFDYCCGGGTQTLADACTRRQLDVETVCELLAALDSQPLDAAGPLEDYDWNRVPIADLCDHIVVVHHDGLRRDLPHIAELVATVVRVHGEGHPQLHDLARTFTSLRSELESHIDSEEREVFPLCRAVEEHPATAIDEQLLADHEHEHADAGAALAVIRELTDDFDSSRALCGTHRALLRALQNLELELHQHLHEENNVLFPRVRELARSAGAGAASSALPLCCQAWAAEQAHAEGH